MIDELSKVNCPVCNNPIPLDNKHWVITCNSCKKEIEIVGHNGKIVSVRQNIPLQSYDPKNYEIFIDYVEKKLPLEKWGFSKSPQLSTGDVIYDSEFCRVKFELSQFNYHPLLETIIYYGRLHAPNNEKHISWNGEKCLCWHSNIHITLPFIEGINAQQLADGNAGEIWQSLVNNLKVDYPSFDYLEYPLRFHAKIWEHYGENLFSIFDLRKPEIWEKYSKYSSVYNEAVKKRLNLSRDIEKIC